MDSCTDNLIGESGAYYRSFMLKSSAQDGGDEIKEDIYFIYICSKIH
jgi:hypothetical protein